MNNKYINKLEYSKIIKILADFCITDMGKDLANMLQPENNKDTVRMLLQETTEATSLIYKKHSPEILPINNLLNTIHTLEINGILDLKSFLEISKVLKVSNTLKKYYMTDNENSELLFPILEKYFSMLYTNTKIQEIIERSILDEFTIADDASKELSNIRRNERKLEEKIKNQLNSFIHSSSYSKYIQENLVTIRNNRYVIPVKEEYRNMVKGFIHDVSSSGSTVFIEPMIIFELNNEMSHLKANEMLEIENILKHLSEMLYPITNELKSNIELIGKIDFIFAKAKYAIKLHATEPKLNDKKFINFISARHPLIDESSVVPININLGIDYSTLVITGPNTGGKTVSLKTVGLLTLMACSGLHIPVNDNSSVYVFDNVYADIGDEQSIQESLSTFSSHMVNIVDILNNSTSNSLVLLDELGSGTDPVEGNSLAISILESLFNKGLLTMATTHYPEIKNYALINTGFENASFEFDIQNLKPTYQLLIGIPGKSNAFEISKKLGLSESIIDRASSFMNSNEIHIEELLKSIYDNKILIEEEKKDIDKKLIEIENLKNSIENKNNNIKDKENSIIENAKIEANRILTDAKDEASNRIREIMKIYDNIDTNSIKSLNNIRNKLNESIKKTVSISDNLSVKSPLKKDDIIIGMNVYIRNLNKYGTVVSIPNKSNQVQIQIEGIKMMVNLTSIEKANVNLNENKPFTTNTSYKINKTKTATTEINVIGYNVEEAIFTIDKYLDDCSLSKLNNVRIVHGKGTGTLRKAIHAFLKTNPLVKSYRLGTFGEGEMGVTIVELK